MRSRPFDPLHLDVEVFAKEAAELQGEWPLATLTRLIPVEPPEDAPKIPADFLYEPEPKDVLDALLPRYVEGQVYRAVLENAASEQAARMQAMRNASDNAEDLIGDLTLTANKVRQSTITTELMEIVSGAAALEG